MLNHFAATEHMNYAKSARLHLQNLLELESFTPGFTEILLNTDTIQFVEVTNVGQVFGVI